MIMEIVACVVLLICLVLFLQNVGLRALIQFQSKTSNNLLNIHAKKEGDSVRAKQQLTRQEASSARRADLMQEASQYLGNELKKIRTNIRITVTHLQTGGYKSKRRGVLECNKYFRKLIELGKSPKVSKAEKLRLEGLGITDSPAEGTVDTPAQKDEQSADESRLPRPDKPEEGSKEHEKDGTDTVGADGAVACDDSSGIPGAEAARSA